MRKRTFELKVGTGWLALLTLLSLLLAACGDNTATTAPAATAVATKAATTAAATTAATATTAAATTAAQAGNGAASPGAVATIPAVSGGNTTGVTDTEIKIGNFSPQTGNSAVYGIIARTADAYFKKVNEEGGINNRKIKFIFEDDGYQIARTQAVTKKLVEQDKVFSMFGGFGTPTNQSVREYLTTQNVPNVAFISGATVLVDPPQKIAFGVLPSYTFEGTIVAQYAADQLKVKKVGVFYQNDAFGKDAQSAFVKEAKNKGLDVVAEVPYDSGTTDLSSQALRLQQSGAEMVFINAVVSPGSTVLKEMNKLGYKPQVVLAFVQNDQSFWTAAGKAAEGAITTSFHQPIESDEPKMVEFRNFMKKYLPNENAGSSFAVWGYSGAQIVVEGLKRAGSQLTRESFLAALESINNWPGSIGSTVSYGPTGRNAFTSLYFVQYKDGKVVRLSEALKPK